MLLQTSAAADATNIVCEEGVTETVIDNEYVGNTVRNGYVEWPYNPETYWNHYNYELSGTIGAAEYTTTGIRGWDDSTSYYFTEQYYDGGTWLSDGDEFIIMVDLTTWTNTWPYWDGTREFYIGMVGYQNVAGYWLDNGQDHRYYRPDVGASCYRPGTENGYWPYNSPSYEGQEGLRRFVVNEAGITQDGTIWFIRFTMINQFPPGHPDHADWSGWLSIGPIYPGNCRFGMIYNPVV